MPEGRPGAAQLAVEVLLTLAVAAALSPLLVDLWGGIFTEAGARLEQGLALAVVWPLEQARALGAFDGPGLLQAAPWVGAVALALLLTGIAAALDPPPGTAPSRLRRALALPWTLLVGPPLLLVALVVIAAGAALDPPIFAALLGAGVLGGFLGRTRRAPLGPWERSLSGLPPARNAEDHMLRLLLLWGALAVALGGAAVGGLPFEGTPLRLARAIDRSSGGPRALTWGFAAAVLLGLALAPHTRRALRRSRWEPWVAGAVGLLGLPLVLRVVDGEASAVDAAPLGLAMASLGAVLAAAGVPFLPRLSPHPLRSVGRAWMPMAAAAATGCYTLAVGFLGCPEVAADPRIRMLSDVPAPSAVAFTAEEPPAVFASWGREGSVLRLDPAGGPPRLLDPRDLQVGRAARRGEVRPALLGRAPGDEVVLLADVLAPGEPPATALLRLDPSDGAVLDVAYEPGPCGVATWTWNPILSVGLVGCRETGEVLVYERSLGRFLARQELVGAKEVQAIAVDPIDGALLTLARRRSPFLVRYDLEHQRPSRWRFLGMSNLTLLMGDDGLLWVPRFLGRQVLALDPVTLEPRGAVPAGFGLGPAVDAPRSGRLIAASLLDGQLYAVDPRAERPTEALHVGGAARDLALSPDGRTLAVAGMCGVLTVDLDRWLEPGAVSAPPRGREGVWMKEDRGGFIPGRRQPTTTEADRTPQPEAGGAEAGGGEPEAIGAARQVRVMGTPPQLGAPPSSSSSAYQVFWGSLSSSK